MKNFFRGLRGRISPFQGLDIDCYIGRCPMFGYSACQAFFKCFFAGGVDTACIAHYRSVSTDRMLLQSENLGYTR